MSGNSTPPAAPAHTAQTPTTTRVAPAPSRLSATTVTTRAELEAAWDIRLEVFVVEQQVPLEEEVDDADTAETTTHVLVLDAAADPEGFVDADGMALTGLPVGTGRLLTDPAHPGEVHIGRVAVRAPWRGSGAGAFLMQALEDLAASRCDVGSSVRIELSGQEQALGFYERIGYTTEADRYLDAGIWHRDAWKIVPGRRTVTDA